MPARWAAAFGGWMALIAVLFVLAPADAQSLVRVIGGLSAVAAVAHGVRRNQPADRMPWRLLGLAVVLSAFGAAAYRAPAWALDHVPGLSTAGGVLALVGYPVLAGVLLVLIRRRTGGLRDRAALLDSLTLTSGVALLAWSFVLGPDLKAADDWSTVAFPLADLLLLGLLTRLLTAGRPVAAGRILGAGLLVSLAGDIVFQLGLSASAAAVGHFALFAAAGLTALHPSMIELSRAAPAAETELTRPRLALLGLASMMAPAVLLVRMFRDGEVPDLTVVAILSAVTFLLVLVRMAGIMASHRLALARERALRRASAALVSANATDEVNAAVRVAVAELLPPDTPHGVVLAMAVDGGDGGPTRIVPTRDVDWAVAVRLTNFSMTLRSPMMLGDRPAGASLLGVLHVGAPSPLLPGLLRAVEVLAGQAALALERIELSHEVIRRNSETYFRTLVQNTADVILIVDELDRIRYASPSAATVLGRDPSGTLLPGVIHPGDRGRLDEVLAAIRAGDTMQEGLDFRAVGHRRTPVLLEMHSQDLRSDPTVAGVVVTLRDVTERRRLEQELIHQAFHDSMTGLANRVLFHDRLGHALHRGARDGSVVGVLFIDLDDFKKVNDTLGHAVGDQLLITVAHRIAGALRADDTAARLGGDEFAALVENVQDPGAVEETAQRILTALAEPVPLDDGTTIMAVASIGITTTPEADSADELLRQADLALYVAKGAGKNQWRRYQADLHGAMVERLELRSALDHAAREGHFLLAYQPIVDLGTDEPVGYEALVRWHHPTRGVVQPAEFIEVAEESGLVVPMGRWVLEQALHTVAQWRRILPRSRQPYVSVNVSVRQFREAGFADEIKQALAKAAVPPHALMLELNETALAGENESIRPVLQDLRDHGVRIAVDYFGSELDGLPLDVVKIDKSAIDDIAQSQDQLTRVQGMVALSRQYGLTVIAEGIESTTHRDLLAWLGCPLGQGYLFSSPVDGTEALSQMTDRLPLVA
ncbi:putative bifunctional diguanylate cyclase/phosphodiesterase [Paractinoplanes atraurantiacus]|uniref:PAS domain S-box-containing protein/diguanylate cyclase (GGDEF) domain-containing protein n=1 Tax=Paractinoplanes atraurantiacus TaxID=1036182 RepID=A0A285IPF5_9ACTN|nr:EAL domain-containing protein [Actinoplanes atraurantiacus]SNY49733.1 PAS domain S-box-containing protein/diguanylate cyclase (GGDEF) domain-containing protein [Actinoplanes atraurantiacus]